MDQINVLCMFSLFYIYFIVKDTEKDLSVFESFLSTFH